MIWFINKDWKLSIVDKMNNKNQLKPNLQFKDQSLKKETFQKHSAMIKKVV